MGDEFHCSQSTDRVMHLRAFAVICCFALSYQTIPTALATAPVLYSQPGYESPVQGAPDDLLMLGGHELSENDAVIYEAVGNPAISPSPPEHVPDNPTSNLGYAPVVSHNNTPYALTIRLPDVMRPHQAYSLWVRTARGEWSNPVKINDMRPLWLTPAFVYATGAIAGLPRYLKLVGRNLEADARHVTRIKLSGPQTIILSAQQAGAVMDAYVAQVRLPPNLSKGRYKVMVTRDDIGWVELKDQIFEVRADPAPAREFAVSDVKFGACRPNDDRDDTDCVIKAIAAVKAAGGGEVLFGPGVWNLTNSASPGVTPGDGIVVPEGVNLRGMGPKVTRLLRDALWNAASPTVAFTLRGHNVVDGFTFADSQIYRPTDRTGPFLQVGENSDRLWVQSHSASPVRELVITHNRFDRTDTAIGAGGLAIEALFITYNEFGAYRNELELGGNLFNMRSSYRIDDSVIAHNTFKPGSFLQLSDRLGPIASEIGASRRLDFSDNTADGTSTDYLYSPDDARGWRAAFFWHMNDSHEMLLISNNVATCTGDKIGDGEAIAFDNSGNTFAFDAMRPVLAAGPASITVDGPLAASQYDRDVPVTTYYLGHWVQVGDGPGMGQARRITAYVIDAESGHVTFTVFPAWDVVPVRGATRVSVGREFWQALIIGNRVDHRSPPCQKSNRSRPVGGAIALWAQLADSVVAGNEQYDTDGVVFHENYNSSTRPCVGCGIDTFFQSFLDIRDNLIDGKYDTGSDCSASGITGQVSSSPSGSAPPPTLGYGVAISHNRVLRADNTVGGAISVVHGWYDGPAPHRWPLLENLIIQHNHIEGIAGPIVGRTCAPSRPRLGISFPGSPLTWKTVLYANSCEGVKMPVEPGGKDTVRVCSTQTNMSCECLPSGSGQ